MKIRATTSESGAARFSRHVALTLGAKVAIALGSILAGIVVARLSGAASVGILASLNVMLLIAVTLGGMGLPSALTFLVARDRSGMKAVMINAAFFAFAVGALLILGIITLAFVRPELFGDIPLAFVITAALTIPFQLLTLFCHAAFLGLGDIKRYNLLDLASQGILIINPLVVIGLLGLGLAALVTANVAATAILSLLVLPILFRSSDAHKGHGFDKRLLGEMLLYGSKFHVAMISAVIILRADLLLVNYFRSAAEAGVYAVASQAGTLMLMIPGVISTVLFPRVAEAGHASADITCRVTRHAALIMLCFCLAVIPAAFLLPLLYGPAFAEVPFLIIILLPGIYLLGIEYVQVQYFNSLGLPKAIPLFWLSTMIVNVVLNLIFVPIYGAYASAAVSSVSYSMMFSLVAIYFRRQTGKSFSEAFVIHASEIRSFAKGIKRVETSAE